MTWPLPAGRVTAHFFFLYLDVTEKLDYDEQWWWNPLLWNSGKYNIIICAVRLFLRKILCICVFDIQVDAILRSYLIIISICSFCVRFNSGGKIKKIKIPTADLDFCFVTKKQQDTAYSDLVFRYHLMVFPCKTSQANATEKLLFLS